MTGKFKKGGVANPRGNTGRRGVHYVSPGHTRVIYEDRQMDIHFKETPSEFVKKVRHAKSANPGMMYVDESSFKKLEDKYLDRVDANRKKGAKKAAATRKKKKGASAKGKGSVKGASSKPRAPKTIEDFFDKPKPASSARGGKRKTKFERQCEFIRNAGYPLRYVGGEPIKADADGKEFVNEVYDILTSRAGGARVSRQNGGIAILSI